MFPRFVTDGTVAILMSMLFFVIPSKLPRFRDYGFTAEGKGCVCSYISCLKQPNRLYRTLSRAHNYLLVKR